ncbi:hypothetical protein HMPREF1862_00846 [Varibaculum cambriense]|uniref:Uncharacterized protein n=1 Tax=Varibaculum cambriense TaxID=184870 RepID=A0AB34X069_9ACTO|nr:hypothetical protein HMPREF1862_00846 [Varibaculum cambriense]
MLLLYPVHADKPGEANVLYRRGRYAAGIRMRLIWACEQTRVSAR